MADVRKIDSRVSEIILSAGDYSAGIYTFGAVLHSFSIGGRDIVVGYDSYTPYLAGDGYMSEVIGPFANRIAGASFMMDGRRCTLEKNDGENSLHSGSRNFGSAFWKIDSAEDSSVQLSLESREGGGFPGNHHAEVVYTLTPDGRLSILYRLSSDERCPVNMTNHAYFNLDGAGDVRNHMLTLSCPEYLETTPDLIPAGRASVSSTDFDFRTGEIIGKRRNGEYDTCFVFGRERKAVLENDEYRLSVVTDLPAIQIYTGISLSSPVPGKGGRMIVPFSGVAMETEFFPDFPNHPEYPGAYTEPGKTFESMTTYQLVRK